MMVTESEETVVLLNVKHKSVTHAEMVAQLLLHLVSILEFLLSFP